MHVNVDIKVAQHDCSIAENNGAFEIKADVMSVHMCISNSNELRNKKVLLAIVIQ